MTVLLTAALLAPARAQDAAALYASGAYEAAIAAGEAAGSAEGLTVAAQAAFADASLREAPCLACFARAHAIAKRAIAADPSSARAYVYLTIAIGHEARIVGRLRSLRARYAEETQEAVATALKLAPGDPLVLATAGGWHIEMVRVVGSFLGRVMYGVRFEEGVAYFKRALAADPSNATLQVQYALALSSTALDSMRGDIKAALAAAGQAPARNAYDAAMKARAASLLQLLDQGRDDAVLATARHYLGIP